MQQPRSVDVRWEWINQGWEMYQKQLGNWLLMSLIVWGITLLLGIIFGLFGGAMGIFSAMRNSRFDPNEIQALMFGTNKFLGFIMVLINSVVMAFFYGGMYKAAFKQLRGEQISVNDLFAGMEHFGSIAVVKVIIAFLTQLICLCLFIPGILLAGLLFFIYPLIVDRRLGPVEAMKTSLQVTGQNWLMFILFGTAVWTLSFAGYLACCIGVVVTYPLLFTITVVAYRDCFGTPGGSDSYEPPPPPIYGGYEPPPPPSAWQ